MKRFPTLAVLLAPLPLAAATVEYEKQLLPLLKDNCLPCHNKTTTKGGLNMETVGLMLKGGDNGTGLVAGDGAKSLIYQAAAGEWDSEMPPKNNKVSAVPLTGGQLALLKQWIDEGAHHQGKAERVIAWEPLPSGFTPIYATALSADGQFAAAARGNQVSIRHLPTGRLITRLTDPALLKAGLYQKPGVAHRDIVPSLAFSPDGRLLATGSFREVKLWRRSETPAATDAPAAVAAAFKAAADGADGVNLLDAKTGKPVRRIAHGANRVAFTLSRDGSVLATAGVDGKLKLWQTGDGKLLREISGDAASARRVAETTYAVERAALEAAWWTERVQKTGKEVTDLDARLKKGHELAATAQKALAEKQKETEAKTSARTQAEAAVKALETPTAPAAPQAGAPSPPDPTQAKKLEDARAALAKADEAAKAAAEALKRAQAAVADAKREIELVTGMKAEAQKLAAAAKASLDQSKAAQAPAEAARAQATAAQAGVLKSLNALAFAPDGSQLAALDEAGTLRTWAVGTGLPVTTTALKPALAWPDPRGPRLTASVPADPAQADWQLERVLGSGDAKSPISDRVNALAFHPDGKTLAVGSGEPSRSGDLTLWNIAEGRLTARWDEVHLDSVLALEFSPDGQHLASGGADKALRVVDTATGKVVKVFEGHTHHILGVSWRADGRLLASGGADAVVKVWDWTTGERRQNFAGWDKEVTAVRYLGGSDLLATCSGDAKVRLLDGTGKEVKNLTGAGDFLNSLATTPQGGWLITGGQEGRLHAWLTPATSAVVVDLGTP